MPRVPYIPFYLSDFYEATAHLEYDVRHTYRSTLDAAWMSGRGSLPNDLDAIRRMIGISVWKWARRRDQVMPFWFVGEDGRLHNKRLDLEWSKVVDRHKTKTAAILENIEKNMAGSFKPKGPRKRLRNCESVVGKPKQPTTENPAITTRARPPASEPGEELSALKAERVLPSQAQSHSEPPAPLRSLEALAPRAAPNGGSQPPTNGADPMPDPDAIARVTAAMAKLKRDLAAKNLEAFERQPLQPDPTIQGATQEERERAAALARLNQLQADLHAKPLPRLGRRS